MTSVPPPATCSRHTEASQTIGIHGNKELDEAWRLRRIVLAPLRGIKLLMKVTAVLTILLALRDVTGGNTAPGYHIIWLS